MGLIPRPFIDELLSQIDIVAYIDSFVPLKKQGHNFVACCPFHHEKTPSFNVIPKKQFYHCFGCGASGNAISFAMQYLNQNFTEAVESLAMRTGLAVPRENTSSHKPLLTLYQILARTALFYQKALLLGEKPALNYLKQRGINENAISRFQLGYAPKGWHVLTNTPAFKPHQEALLATGMIIQKEKSIEVYDRYRHRLMFPIHDKQGRIIGFGGRALGAEDKPKYLNSPETAIFHKSRELYGLFQALQHNAHPPYLLVVEGYMDVIALAQAGIPYAVATLGTATSLSHIQLLAKYTSHVIFCFDGDLAGQQAAQKALMSLLPALNSTLSASFIFLPENHDPDSFLRTYPSSDFLKHIEDATPLHIYLLKLIEHDCDTSTLQGKNQLIHHAKSFLEKIPESPFKSLILDELAKRTHLDTTHLSQHLTTPMPAVNAQPTIKRTPLRIAAALLLQNPDIYQTLQQTYPSANFLKTQPMLAALMQAIETTPDITTASLVERFRENDWFEAISKLASWDILILEETVHQELADTLAFIIEKEQAREVQKLLKQAKEQGLTTEERQKLQQLVHSPKQKKQPSSA